MHVARVCVLSRVCVFREELANLQRQVENLGRNLQTPHPPSNYQAPTTHAPITNRISNSSADAGFGHTGGDSPRNTSLRHHDNNTGNSDTHQNRDISVKKQKSDSPKVQNKLKNTPEIAPVQENKLTKQSSKEIIDNNQLKTQKDVALEENPRENVENTLKEETHTEIKQNESQEENKVEKENSQTENTVEKRPEEYENQNYTEQGYENYEQNYEQQQYSEQPTYSEQEYAENTEYPAQEYNEQQQYTEQYENYEQYIDPNTQYETQQEYENYATDGNYSNQNYENPQEDYAPEFPNSAKEITESVESKTLDEKLTSQS
ncbi:unnamed protein product [Danaus chrysippus]|uniref:(African queen) hypothetical protein n=1 Tax=Danaus chrysippus TaxID=151541 RepID=A0A8J2W042_9NEOP|nr:unnamed protein product [Danaus chrysippus]